MEPSNTTEIVDRDEYDTFLQRLSDVQLQCEYYVRYAKGNQDIYGSAGPELVTNLQQAERLLGKMISEWEDKLTTFSGEPPVQRLVKLPKLAQFIEQADKGLARRWLTPFNSTVRCVSATDA